MTRLAAAGGAMELRRRTLGRGFGHWSTPSDAGARRRAEAGRLDDPDAAGRIAWKVDHFNHAFAVAVRAAGLVGLSFHGLRKTAAAWLAEAGASASEIAAITGHRTLGEVTRYTAAADRRSRASAVMGRTDRRHLTH